jgi:ribosomal protein S12 methylthiotransferase accessory factor
MKTQGGSAASRPVTRAHVEVRAVSDTQTLVIAGRGKVYRLNVGPPEVIAALETGDQDGPLRDLFQQLSADGVVVDDPALIQWSGFKGARPDPSVQTVVVGVDDRLRPLATATSPSWIKEGGNWATVAGAASLLRETRSRGRVAVVTLHSSFDYECMVAIDDLCQDLSVPWAPFHLDLGFGWFGPLCPGQEGLRYRDLLVRRQCAVPDEHVIPGLLSKAVFGDPFIPPPSELAWMLGAFWSDVDRWLHGAEARAAGAEIELDPVELTLRRHPVLPLPHRSDTHMETSSTPADLVDSRTGIVTRIKRINFHPSIPRQLITAQSYVADMARFYSWAPNIVNAGSSMSSFDEARAAAVGEAVERYCGNAVAQNSLVHDSYSSLRARGISAVNPSGLILYSADQYEAAGFPYVPFTEDLRVHWVPGKDLATGSEVLVPASMVYVNWYSGEYAHEPPVTCPYYPGLAAGTSLEMALLAAIEEIIERDAMMTWWLAGDSLPAVRPRGSLAPLAELFGDTGADGVLAGWMMSVPNAFGAPVAAAAVHDRSKHLLYVGFACRATLKHAARKAYAEALGLHETARDVQKRDGVFWKLAATGLGEQSLKPWRADRRYLDLYSSDYTDVDNLYCQIQFYLDPRAEQLALPLVSPSGEIDWAESDDLQQRTLPTYQRLLEDQGFSAVYVNVTTPDVAATGLRVVRVLVPGLVPNFPTAFPPLGSDRPGRVATELGWAGAFRGGNAYNILPLPYA